MYVELVAKTASYETGMASAADATLRFEKAQRSAAGSMGTQLDAEPILRVNEQLRVQESLFKKLGLAVPGSSYGHAQEASIALIAEMDRQDKQRQVDAMTEADRRWNSEIALMQRTADVQESLFSKLGLRQPKEFDTRINPQTSMFAQQTTSATIETKKLWSAQTQAKVAANALAYSLGTTAAGGAAGATRNFGSTAADSTRKYARFGLVMQQAGYQVQDFAVQVAGGQNKLVAFSQQGAQLLGVFGVGGAIAGAVLSTGVLIARMAGLGDEMGKEKATVDSLAESFRQLAIAKNPSLAQGFEQLDVQKTQKEYEKQNEIIKKLEGEQSSLLKTKNEDLKKNIAVQGYSAGLTNLEASYVSQLKAEYEKLDAIQQKLNKLSVGPSETGRKSFEDRRDTIIAGIKAEQDSRKETYLSFAEAKKQNTLDEMDNEKKLNYYIREMKLLESIGAKETANYEIAKKRTRELGTILLGESGPKEIKTLDQYNKTVAGLQSKVPESLGLNQGALSSGLLVGGASPSALIDISQQILAGIRQLVNIEYMGQRSY